MFGFLPHNLFTNHIGQNTTGLSPRLWSRVSGSVMASDGDKRLVLAGDDFTSFYGTVATKVGDYSGGYKSYEETSTSIVQASDQKGGVIQITADGTDNDDIALAAGGAAGVLGAISDTAADAHLTAFECRFKTSTVTDDESAFFLGLAEEGLAAAASIANNTGIIDDKDHIGFSTNHLHGGTAGENAKLDFAYQLSGATRVVKIATLQTLAADTWYKVGFVYDPDAEAAKRITVYLDNAEQSTYVTATNISTSTGSAFPDGQELTFNALQHSGGTAAGSVLSIDWWAFAQLIA